MEAKKLESRQAFHRRMSALLAYGSGGVDPDAKWVCPSCGEEYADPKNKSLAINATKSHAIICRDLKRDIP